MRTNWRVYFRGGAHATAWSAFRAFGPVDARFDHHLPPTRVQERQILYAAASPLTCLAEVYQATRRIHARLGEPRLVGFAVARPLRLLDLSGSWPTRLVLRWRLPPTPFFNRALGDPLLRVVLENAAAELGYDLLVREGGLIAQVRAR